MSNPFGAAPGVHAGMPVQSTMAAAPQKESATPRVTIGPFVLSYPNLFVARQKMGQPKPGEQPSMQYSCELLCYSSNPQAGAIYNALMQAANAVSMAKFGKSADSAMFRNKPIRSLAERENSAEPGFFLSARTTQKPSVVVGSPPVACTDPDELYAGCHVYVNVTPGTYDFEGNKGVKWYLNSVWKVAEGPRLAPVRDAASDFASLVGTVQVNLAQPQIAQEELPPWAQPQQANPQQASMPFQAPPMPGAGVLPY